MHLSSVKKFAVAALVTLPITFAHADNNPVILKFKNSGKVVRLSDLKNTIETEPQLKGAPLEMVFTPLRSKMIAENLIDIAVQKDKNLANNAEVKKLTALCTAQVKRDVFMRQQIEKLVTDAAVQEKYKEFAATYKGQDAVELRHILVSDKDQAAQIIGQLNNGADFAKLAKEKSLDPNSQKGETLGLLTKNELPPSFAEVAFSLKKNEYAKTPVQSEFGWHVIKLVDKKPAKAPTFDKVKDDLKAGMMQAKAQEVIQGLIETEGLEAYDIDGTPAGGQQVS